MMIVDDQQIKIGDLILPGFFQKMEVDAEVKIDEVDVKGKSVKPKQATGYEDGKIKLYLILQGDQQTTIYDKLLSIQNIFKQPDQQVPLVYNVFNEHLNVRGIDKIIFKKLTSKETNKIDTLEVICEFWEYIPITIQTAETDEEFNLEKLSKEYQDYLAGRQNLVETAAVDDDIPEAT
jgi:hypothetical protein